jgi:galactose oxidase
MSGVKIVRPIADARYSVAFLYLNHDGLPDLERWPAEFARAANGSYGWRGVEVTLEGTITFDGAHLTFSADRDRAGVTLAPLQADDKVQLDTENGIRRPLPVHEMAAYEDLARRMRSTPGPLQATVTGPLINTNGGFVLQVRRFE